MKAVFSYWNPNQGNSGFNSLKDCAISFHLAVENARKHFDNVEIYTNQFGINFIEKYGIKFDKVHNDLDQFDNLNPIFWGYTKVYTYSVQKEPFIHIDNDVYLWNAIPKQVKEAPIFFQSIEDFTNYPQYYGYYIPLLKKYKEAPVQQKFIHENPSSISYNCGIIGVNDLELVEEWYKLSSEYVLDPKNQDFFKNEDNLLIHQNLLHEQYFISSIIKNRNIQPEVLLKDITENVIGYTHLWGLTKRDRNILTRVYNRVERDYPEFYKNWNRQQ